MSSGSCRVRRAGRLGGTADADLAVGGLDVGLRVLVRILGDLHPTRAGALDGGADELPEQGLGVGRPRVELRVELRGDEEGVLWQLDDLDEALVRRGAADHKAVVL